MLKLLIRKRKICRYILGKIHYLSAGEGRPAVFLHGGILSSYDFKKDVIEAASKEGYHANAFDRPGYGYSERPKEKITPFDQAEVVNEALKKIGVNERNGITNKRAKTYPFCRRIYSCSIA